MFVIFDVVNIKFIEVEDGVIVNIFIVNVLFEGFFGGYVYSLNSGNFSFIFINVKIEENLVFM